MTALAAITMQSGPDVTQTENCESSLWRTPCLKSRTRSFMLIAAAVGCGLLVILGTVGEWYLRGLSPRARDRLVAALSDRFDADVKLDSLKLTLYPTPRVEGRGLRVKRHNRASRAPFLQIGRFVATAAFRDLFYQHDRVGRVELEGLVIDIPPRREELADLPQHTETKQSENTLKVLIDTLVANGAVLQIEPNSPDKDPLRFDIQKLEMHSVGPGHPLRFVTTLQNAKPPGSITSSGTFGPWRRDDLRATPVSGAYKFTDADLGVFSGISGTLASTGRYGGQLDNITVDGQTDVPNFALKRGGAPVHLTTEFHAVVDGTNGDTLLQPVKAHFLNSSFLCKGGVEEEKPHDGKTIHLEAAATNARIEDILVLVSGDSKRLLTGDVQFHSLILLPPGKQDVIDKLRLKGRFTLASAVFADKNVEHRIETISDRARGVTKKEQQQEAPHIVASNLMGDFVLDRGQVDFSRLAFTVPGAAIKLKGGYNLETQNVDMKGVFRMQATLADTQSGFKHWLLKPFDPLFEKDGAGFEVPLTITGTRSQPEVEVRALHHTWKLK